MSHTESETLEMKSMAGPESDRKGFVPNVIHRLRQQGKSREPSVSKTEDTIAMTEISSTGNHEAPSSNDAPAIQSESWKYPKGNTFRVFATCWAFLVMGANDATYGVSLRPADFNSITDISNRPSSPM